MKIKAQDRVKLFKEAIKNGMVMLPYDVETSHSVVKTFYIGQKVNLNHSQVMVPGQVISIQYMLPGMKNAKYLEWDNVGKGEHDDSSMIEEFVTNLWDKAHIVLGQNNDGFDYKVLNDRAMLQKLPPMDQKPSIDVLKLSRKSFRALSHKLDFRSARLGHGGKLRMVEQDWFDVEDNKVPVSKKMGPYGCKDVEDTLKVFWDELPYYKSLPADVEKIVLQFTRLSAEKAPFCTACKKRRQSRFNIKTKRSKDKLTHTCNNCTKTWTTKV